MPFCFNWRDQLPVLGILTFPLAIQWKGFCVIVRSLEDA